MTARATAIAAVLLALAAVAPRAEEEGVSLDASRTEDGVDEGPAAQASGWSGDLRLRVRSLRPAGASFDDAPPELKHAPHVDQRVRLFYGRRLEAVARAVRPAPGPPLTWSGVRRHGLLKYALRVDGLVAGHYKLSYGQGLLFYDQLGEFVRPVKVKTRRPRPDDSSGRNDYFKGAAWSVGKDDLRMDLFYSDQRLGLAADEDYYALRQRSGLPQSDRDLDRDRAQRERLAGGRVAGRLGPARLGVTAYQSRFSVPLDPDEREFRGTHLFRGDRASAGGVDSDLDLGPCDLFGEAAWSRGSGGPAPAGDAAWTAGALGEIPDGTLWAGFFRYGPGFFSPHGKGPSFAILGDPEDLPDNQRGAFLGGLFKGPGRRTQATVTLATFPAPLGFGNDARPIHPSRGRRIFLEHAWEPDRAVEVYVRYQGEEQDAFLENPADGRRRQTEQIVEKHRYQFTWEAFRGARLRLRYDTRRERAPAFGRRAFGEALMGEVRWVPPRCGLALSARAYAFQSPEAFLGAGTEEVWDGVQYFRFAGAMNNFRGAPGTRWALTARRDVGDSLRLWAKYDANLRPAAPPARPRDDVRRALHFQADVSWGGGG